MSFSQIPYDEVFGYSSDELTRLGCQHELFLPFMREHLGRAGIKSTDTVLDLGCGPGFTTVTLARLAKHVIALDRDPSSLAAAKALVNHHKLSNVTFLDPCEAHELRSLPSPVSFVYIRWMLCYLHPRLVLQLLMNMHNLLGARGKIVIQDFTQYADVMTYPQRSAVTRRLETIQAGIANPNVGDTLGTLLTSIGFRVMFDRELRLSIARPSRLWAWPDEFLRLHGPVEGDRGIFLRDWDAICANPHAVFHAWPIRRIAAFKV